MSQKPVNLELALAELREDHPSSAAERRLRQRLASSPLSRRFRSRPLLIGATMVGALAIGSLSRSKDAGMAWAQVVQHSAEAPFTHWTFLTPKGEITAERWNARDGRVANYGYFVGSPGKVLYEYRRDGKRSFRFFQMPIGHPTPNMERVAIVSPQKSEELPFTGNSGQVEEIIRDRNAKVLDKKTVQTPLGERLRYRLLQPKGLEPTEAEILVDVDPSIGRVTQLVSPRVTIRMEYPQDIPQETFDVDRHRVKNVAIFDTEKSMAIIRKRLDQGLGKDKGVTFRLALLDYTGAVWLFWTGAMPDGRLSHPARLPGIPTGNAAGPKILTSSAKGMPKGHLEGHALTPSVKIGATLPKVIVPTPHGDAVFSNIPVMRIGLYADFWQILHTWHTPK